ncbi:hypothetical protein [Shouchella lonarensis]|uniref:Uncharacterized protein n=1 Tax=Shouchella lonarensis TaxID=1464122 RepID=A0A1G6H174_9BACI|nr:hypothetical protein [Shouchella lonarensis]SDB87904.1 hypothetical protein SAMN05421737_102232 [Shouchella lonarensis]
MKRVKQITSLSILSIALLIPGTTSEAGAMSTQVKQGESIAAGEVTTQSSKGIYVRVKKTYYGKKPPETIRYNKGGRIGTLKIVNKHLDNDTWYVTYGGYHYCDPKRACMMPN